MEVIELTKFTGGLVLRPSADDIQGHQVQSAENVDFTLEPGVIGVRRGIAKKYETEFSGTIDIFWQSIFGDGGLMIRAGDKLYDEEDHLIMSNLTDATMRFEQFDDWLIFCNGSETVKYKREGMELSWNSSYTAPWEALYTDSSDYATILISLYSTTDYRCCFGWEVQQVQGDTVDAVSPLLYTSSCYIGISIESTTTWALGGNVFVAGDTIVTSSATVLPAWYLITSVAKYGWMSGASDTVWVKFHLSEPEIPGRLWMQAAGTYNKAPNEFTLKGSDTGAFTGEEELLLTVTGAVWDAPNQGQSWDFRGVTSAAYDYYLLEITGKQGAFGESNEYTLTWLQLNNATPTTSSTGKIEFSERDYFPPVSLGLPVPDATSSVATEGGAGNPNGAYQYAVTYRNEQGFEGNLGEFSGSTDITVSSKKVLLTALPISSDPQVTERRIYRTEAGGSTYKLLTTIENNWETTYTDDTADASLGASAPEDHDAPPVFSEVHSHRGLLWGVEAAAKNKAWYCSQFDEWEYFPPTYYENFGSGSDEILSLETLAEFMIYVQEDKIWKYNEMEVPAEKSQSLSKRGILSPSACVNVGDALVLIDAAGLYYFDVVKDLPFSQVIDPIFDDVGDSTDKLDINSVTNIVVGSLEELIYVSYARDGDAENSRTIVYSREAKLFQGLITKGFSSFTTDRKRKKFYGAGSDGYVYEIGVAIGDEASSVGWFFQTKDFSEELGGRHIYKRGIKIRVDIDPQGDDLTVAVYLDGVSRQSLTFNDASRAVKEFRVEPDYDFYRVSIRFSGATDALQKVHGALISAESIG